MLKQLAVAAALFAAIGLSSEDNHRSDIAKNKGNQQVPAALASPNDQAGTPDKNGAKNDPPQWYASPEWWLVIVAFPTLFFIGWQAWEMRSGGETTNRQTQHLINAERAWIQVPEVILVQALSVFNPSPEDLFVWFRPYIVNNGRTQARIIRIVYQADVLAKADGDNSPRPPILPEQPQFDRPIERDIVLSPKQGINWFAASIAPEDLEHIKQRKAFLYVYGRIDYMDISETERHTCFCKIYWIPYGPSDPNTLEGFIDSPVIPRAYTECT